MYQYIDSINLQLRIGEKEFKKIYINKYKMRTNCMRKKNMQNLSRIEL